MRSGNDESCPSAWSSNTDIKINTPELINRRINSPLLKATVLAGSARAASSDPSPARVGAPGRAAPRIIG